MFYKKLSSGIQVVGRSMLLAIACMPAAAILNRLGDHDLLNLPFIKEAAWTIFAVLSVLFAISVAGGIAKDKHVAAGLTGFLVQQIFTRTLGELGDTGLNSFGQTPISFVEHNILLGIIAGIIAGVTYEKFKNKQLPDALAFFGGRRLVIIMGCFFAIVAAGFLSIVFPAIERGFNALGVGISEAGSIGPFLFGFFNRLLIPTGLHHIINTYIQMQLPSADLAWVASNPGIVGEIPRFFAGDPTAGTFVAGFFPMMMFGLPAAGLAMYHSARPENRTKVKGLLLGAALTSFITGITEPIEFSFMFISPILFLLHAVLMGVANLIANLFDARMVGVGGSGIIDFVLQFSQGTRPMMLFVAGIIMAALYYFSFRYLIEKLNLPTPGREAKTREIDTMELDAKALKVIELLGGQGNILELDNCITRLRMRLADAALIDEEALKKLGMIEIIRQSDNRVQVIVGLEVEQLANEMRLAIA